MDQLVARLRTGQLYAMTGSGVSVSAGYRTWDEVIAQLAAVVMERSGAGIDAEVIVRSRQDPLICAEFLSRELSPEDFAGFIRQEFGPKGKPPHELLIRLAQMPFKHILTLNFDESMEEVHDAMKLSYGKVSCSTRAATSTFLDSIDSPDYPRQIVHLHGVYTDPTIVLTEDDYRREYRDSSLFEHLLWLLAATKRIVFLGFGFKDNDFLNAISNAARDMNRRHAAKRDIKNRNWTGHFAVLPISPKVDDVQMRWDYNHHYFVEPIFYERVEEGDDPFANFLPLINGILHQLDLPARPAIEIAEPAAAVELIAEPGDLQRAADLADQFLGKIDPGANNA